MAPPQFPPQQQYQPQHNNGAPKPTVDVNEKYKKLKRKYFDLEEKFKETQAELNRSGERGSRMRHERTVLLDRIIELEQQAPNPPNGAEDEVIQGRSSAFPRSLLPKKAQDYFRANMRVALEEIASEDPKVDPLYHSRHVGPQARKQQEEEMKERQEEEAREARRATKRARVTKGKDATPHGQAFPYQPPPPGSDQGPGQSASVGRVSSSGTRLRIKPPATPAGEPGSISSGPPPSGPASQHGYQQSPSQAHTSPPNQPYTGRSQSPMSNGMSPQDEQNFTFVPTGASGAVVRNHYRSQTNGYPTDGPTVMVSAPARAAAPRATEIQRHAKPKRLKAHTVTSKSHSIPMVPRDKKGRPLLPLNVGIMTVLDLGEVCMREHFHTERYIFPVGYEVTRRYLSTIDPNAEVVYHCSILDGGDGPKFKIIANDAPQKPIIAGTATGAWSTIVKTANFIRNRQHSNSVSGPDFFGLAQNTIKHLIQGLPNADKLKDYVWQNFHEGGVGSRPLGGRHASVVPALPEEYDNSFSYFERDKEKRGRGPARDDESDAAGEVDEDHQVARPPSQTSAPQPLYIHQEYSPYPNERRNSQHDRPPSAASHAEAQRLSSSSPTVNRDQQYQFVDAHGQPHSNGSSHGSHSQTPQQQQSPPYTNAPAVPARFASIMNAYPGPSRGASPPSPDFAHHGNGGATASSRPQRSRKSGP